MCTALENQIRQVNFKTAFSRRARKIYVRRSIRSTLHFSPKNLRISKWYLSGKNGSKYPMFSISMANNVISYKKTHKKKKITDFNI